MTSYYVDFPPNPIDGQEYVTQLGITYYYNSQYNVWTTFPVPSTGYIAAVSHFFINETNTTQSLISSNPGVTVQALNPSAPESVPSPSCAFNPLLRRYSVTFSTPFPDTTYEIAIFGIANVSAGGASSAYNSFLITDKTTSGFNIQFCNRSISSPGAFSIDYRRGFTIEAFPA